jgi:glycosyltransferase involved in cell wall biosynthesis
MLFVHSRRAEFILIDRALLAERFEVRDWFQRRRWSNFAALAIEVARADVVFGWFVSWHAFVPVILARLLRKPVVWVVGGFDTANMPEIGYGAQRGGPQTWLTRFVMRRVGRLVTNSHWSLRELEENVGIARERVTVIHHGVPDRFAGIEVDALPRDAVALTVGVVYCENLRRKGHLPFVQAALQLPDVRFVLAGKHEDEAIDVLRAVAPPNVEFTGWVSDEDLTRRYLEASVYVQASAHEGFGMSVAEAMLAGAIPVVTSAGALPEVVGDVGVIAASAEPGDLAAAIREALGRGPEARAAARRRVLERFSLDQRRAGLYAVLDSVIAR